MRVLYLVCLRTPRPALKKNSSRRNEESDEALSFWPADVTFFSRESFLHVEESAFFVKTEVCYAPTYRRTSINDYVVLEANRLTCGTLKSLVRATMRAFHELAEVFRSQGRIGTAEQLPSARSEFSSEKGPTSLFLYLLRGSSNRVCLTGSQFQL